MTAKDEPSSAQEHEQQPSRAATTTTAPTLQQLHHRHAGIQAAFADQSGKLSLRPAPTDPTPTDPNIDGLLVTPQDPVIVADDGTRIPGVSPHEARELDLLKKELLGHAQQALEEQKIDTAPPAVAPHRRHPHRRHPPHHPHQHLYHPLKSPAERHRQYAMQKTAEDTLRRALPPSHTNPLFPPLPLYGPPSLLRKAQCLFFRTTSFFLSMGFLTVVVLGSLFTSIGPSSKRLLTRLVGRDPDRNRPFYQEEQRRAQLRNAKEDEWAARHRRPYSRMEKAPPNTLGDGVFMPTEGGPDPVVCDIGYYARRVGLAVEEFQVQTEDGFIIELYHVYNPAEQEPIPSPDRTHDDPDFFPPLNERSRYTTRPGNARFPVLLIHGLLQSAGAYCCTDDDSLAFYLCKSGFDVWLGNNRCGFSSRHVALEYSDPRMWCWNIRQMGVFDLEALTSRVRHETGFDKIGLVAHSQGTTQALVALAKEQRPELGKHLSVFCALAPAAYAGPLIGKICLKFMRVISPAMFRVMFGIHAFIPFMMTMHSVLSPRLYGWLGYKVFSFLFDWTDTRWDRGLRDRLFQFAPVYVSAESMRWWLGRECFARHKCILSTREVVRAEECEDLEDAAPATTPQQSKSPMSCTVSSTHHSHHHHHHHQPRGATAWYDEQTPPFALWIAGSDNLVLGEKLLRRFRRGREPYVRVVHAKTIPEYEHLDVIWAMDAPDQVFGELREVLWKTCLERERCRVPTGCERVEAWVPDAVGSESGGIVEEQSSSSEML